MRLEDIPGQHTTKKQLLASIKQSRLGHALLFSGPEECGQLACAMSLAKIMVCQNREDARACEKCPSCLKAKKLIHPDIHFSYPTVGGSKVISKHLLPQWREFVTENPFPNQLQWLQKIEAGNSQGNINIAECGEIMSTLSLKPFESNYKIQIIWMAEKIGKEGNALLKLIEEPPPNTLLILTTTSEENILGTILSRTQNFYFKRATSDEIASYLSNKKEVPPAKALQIAELSSGFIGQALQLLEGNDEQNGKLFLEWMNVCLQNNIIGINAWVDTMGRSGREAQKHFIHYVLLFFDWTLRTKSGSKQAFQASEAESKMVQWLTPRLAVHEIEKLSTIFNKAHYYVERNVNGRLLFFNLSIQLSRTLKRIR